MQPSLILDVVGRASFHTILVFAAYLLVAGHSAPGGGFVGGLTAGAAFVLRYASGGADGVRRAAPVAPEAVLGAGLALAGLTGAAGWLWGTDFLDGSYAEAQLPGLGLVKLTSALAFDSGVALVVLGLVLAVLRTLGAVDPPTEVDPQADAGPSRSAGQRDGTIR